MPYRVLHVSTDRTETAGTPACSISSATVSSISRPASTRTRLPRGATTSSAVTRPAIRSAIDTTTWLPSMIDPSSTPDVVLQSSSRTITSCATSTSRRVR